jgi:hypothetical protein
MNPGKAGGRGEALRSRERGAVWMFKRAYFGDAAWVTRFGIVLVLGALAGLRAGPVAAQSAAMLDERVTQQSIADTICRPDYADAVSPPFDVMMEHKQRLLTERGIGADDSTDYALDRRVPVLLGGSPDAPANLDLLPWAGTRGERRKARFVVHLKRCVCEGKLSLSDAQTAIVGNWSAAYAGFGRDSCDVSGVNVATSSHDGEP